MNTKAILRRDPNSTLHICDIYTQEKSVGIGSALMTSILLYAKQNDFQHLSGEMRADVSEHSQRQHGFYDKFGFSKHRVGEKLYIMLDL